MENSSRHSRPSQLHSSASLKQRRSGYEPSDTETDWHESPWHDNNHKNKDFSPEVPKTNSDLPRNISPIKLSRRQPSRIELDGSATPIRDSVVSLGSRRHNSKSPYKPRRDDGNNLSPISNPKNTSPFSKSERRRHISPYKTGREEQDFDNGEIASSSRKQRTVVREERGTPLQFTVSERPSYVRRSVTAPRPRAREEQENNKYGYEEQKAEMIPSTVLRDMMQKLREASHVKAPSVGELNEMIANAKISKSPMAKLPNFDSTDSIAAEDIFFSRDHGAMAMQKNVLPKNTTLENHFYPKPQTQMPSQVSSVSQQHSGASDNINHNFQLRPSATSSGLPRTTMTSSSAVSRHSSNGKFSMESSKMSDASGITSGSLKKFTANRRKNQSDNCFACMRRGSCKTSNSPERKQFDEAAYIEKAFVVEHLRQFWADKHQPGSLNGFTCHKQEAQLLRQLVSYNNCPHILFKGPSGSGKRALAMAFLREIFGDSCWNISHDLRYFQVQEKRPMQEPVPITSSACHIELNVNLEANARSALMGLVKEISRNYAMTPEVSNVNFQADYKVLVLYEVDKAPENILHLIKWIMDGYTDACKLILCCEDDVDILEPVKNRCKVITVDAPVTHEIMEVLIQIARKEDFDLPMSFAAKIATKSKQNLRKAIMALEACKTHNYPFVDDQPIPLGWEEVLVDLAAEILADPTHNRLFSIRGKIQKLLVDFVHPKLILQKLVEQFLKGIEANLKRELYYWHAYYDKRLPTGTTALLKLEEFVAKFMSICRKSSGNRQYAVD